MVVIAFSLQDQVEKYGAYVGLAAFLGLAVLTVLYFAQARELKRLRDWAGRAPERAQDLEARAVANADEALRAKAAAAEQPATVGPARPSEQPAVAVGESSGNGRPAAKPTPIPIGPRPAVALARAQATAVAATAGGEEAAPDASAADGDRSAEAAAFLQAPAAGQETEHHDAVGGDVPSEQRAALGDTSGAGEPPSEVADTPGPGEPRSGVGVVAGDTPGAGESPSGVGVVAGDAPRAGEPPSEPRDTPGAGEPRPGVAAGDTPAADEPPSGEAHAAGQQTLTPGAEEASAREPEPAPGGTGNGVAPDSVIPRATPRPQVRPAPAAPLRAAAPARTATVPPRRTDTGSSRTARVTLLTLAGLIVLVALAFGATQLFGGDEPKPPPNVAQQPSGSAEAGTGGGTGPTAAEARRQTVVAILNGTPTEGLAGQARDKLVAKGYSDEAGMIRTGNNTDQQRQDSAIFYAPGQRRQARDVASVLGIGSRPEAVDPDTLALANGTDGGGDSADVVAVLGLDQSP